MSETTNETVTQVLRRQHDEVRSMFQQLGTATGDARAELFDCLRATLAVHETAEEEVVHPMARTISDTADEVVRARLDEEREAKQMLADLEKIGVGGAQFDEKLRAFQAAVEAHAAAEEREVFPLLDREKDADMLRTMANALLAAEKIAPTHPHPHGPESAVGNIVVGPVVAVMDRVRDAIRASRSD